MLSAAADKKAKQLMFTEASTSKTLSRATRNERWRQYCGLSKKVKEGAGLSLTEIANLPDSS
ncbi:hypothetical protein NQZ68_000950 [Dissostichus eleginoides]|nr:hypothetical protein NQZ68_000950 [Dissostichus eleginoides]